MPTYSVVVLHPTENQALLPGELGEIGIAGIGLARGYVNRDDLTDRAFIPDFIGIAGNPSGRIYRTGDLGRVNGDGEIEYHGRIDTQVKIRGYRIELTEIESVLLQVPGIAQAVVDTYEPEPDSVELVAYYSLRRDTASLDERHVIQQLRGRLPGYMVPAYLERLEVIPMTASDKADRKSLPAPRSRRVLAATGDYTAPSSGTEQVLADALARVLRVERVSVRDHFFDDLGANSLLMAHFSARVREHADLPALAMQDIYQHPTISKLATVLDSAVSAAGGAPVLTRTGPVQPTSTPRYVLCGILQLLIFLGYTWFSASLLVVAFDWAAGADGLVHTWQRSVVFAAGAFVVLSALPILAKWVLVGRWRPGAIPVWSLAYVRFWTVQTLVRSNPLVLFAGSPLYVLYLRALGANIGAGVTILSRRVPVCTDLLTIGAGTIIRKDSFFVCYRARAGFIEMGPVTLGRNVFVGEKTVFDIDTVMGDQTQLGHCSSLQASQVVPNGQRWHGSPAQRTETNYQVVEPADCGTLRRVLFSSMQLINRLVITAPLGVSILGLVLPTYLGSGHLTLADWQFYVDVLAFTLVTYFGGLLLGLAFVLTVPRILHRSLKPDVVYPLYGWHFAMHRIVARITNRKFFADLFGDSSYIVNYLSALGYDLSRVQQTGSNFGTELQHESPYLTTIGTGTMVSDALSLMNADYSATSFRVSRVSVGERNFLGNNIAFPIGARTGENCLLATKVMIPIDGPVRNDVGLLGSPCFEIPRSVQRDSTFDEELRGGELGRRLAAKNRHNIVTMGLFLLLRWFLLFGATLIAAIAATFYGRFGVAVVAVTILVILLFGITVSVVVEKATLGFRPLKPQFCSIYDHYFWSHERLWKLIATAPFSGTPFKNIVWRLLGVRIGRRVFDAGCSIPEKTLVSIGDDCTLNEGSVIQCHSLEDGTFKSDYTHLGAGCTLGVESFVHYGVTMGEGAVLAADAFLMKGEEVGAHAHWWGNPAREVANMPTAGEHSRVLPSRLSRRRGRHRAPARRGAPRHTPALRAVRPTARAGRPSAVLAALTSPVAAARATSGSTSVAMARTLLTKLRATPVVPPQFPDVGLSLFSLDVCRRNEGELMGFLRDEEELESRTMRSDERRRAFIASRALVRILLSAQWREDVDPRDWRLDRSDDGKLTVQGPAGENGIDVSISHTNRVLAVAVSDSYDVGVDVEPANRRGVDPVVWMVLSSSERQRLAATPVRRRSSQFVQMWTLKEAYAKCIRAGSSLDFADLHTSFEPLAVTHGAHNGATANYRFHQHEWRAVRERHWVAVAVASRPS